MEKEEEQSVFEDDYEDGDVTVLSFWFGDQVSISSMFCERLLRKYFFTDLTGARYRKYSLKVGLNK